MSTKRLLFINLLVIVIVLIGGFVGYYFYNQSTLYLRTDDAQITGQQIVIAAPVSGKLTDWNGTLGSTFGSGDTVGTVSTANAQVPVTMPARGTIVQNNALTNEFIAAGTPLAYAYNMNNLWVTANIKETQIQDVKLGQSVDIYVDGVPNVTFQGTVATIGYTTAGTFSLLPTQNTTGNYTKVTQVIPVTITLSGQSSDLRPGMSATVRIHK